MSSGLPTVIITYTNVVLSSGVSAQLLAADPDREWALIEDDSDTTIYIKFGVSAVVNEGTRLNANGGSFESSARLGNLDTRVVNGIFTGTGTKNVLIQSAKRG